MLLGVPVGEPVPLPLPLPLLVAVREGAPVALPVGEPVPGGVGWLEGHCFISNSELKLHRNLRVRNPTTFVSGVPALRFFEHFERT